MPLRTSRKRSDKAISPAISTVILTGAMVSLVTVALAFASNFLMYKISENDFQSAKLSMQTLGLQIDDVAWISGRTETIRYSSRHGYVTFNQALNYTVYINTTTETNLEFFTTTTGIVCFNMPTSQYSVGNFYYELVYPSTDDGFLLSGAGAPTAKIFAVEKLPMPDGSFARVVSAPIIRMLNLSIGSTSYARLYLPILSKGLTPNNHQSITLSGESVYKLTETVTGIRITLGFPLEGFDNFFFNFPQTEENISFEEETVLELYIGEVDVSFGVHA